ncbi:MAG: LamG-like jellyroll fold domain-containing protein, partial [Planctomycetota bacterium]
AQNAIAAQATTRDRVRWMFQQTLSRDPTASETRQSVEFLRSVRADTEAAQKKMVAYEAELSSTRSRIAAIRTPALNHLTAEQTANPTLDASSLPRPLISWSFGPGRKGNADSLKIETHAGAQIKDGALVVHRGGFATTLPIPKDVTAKTLEAWVQLDNLQQRGGGVMTIQSTNGDIFDAIVFGEQEAGKWLAGSNHFARSKAFAGPAETQASKELIHLVITYQPDGTITGYRNGRPYGSPFQVANLQRFRAGETIVGFGIRHLPAGGNRLLAGRIAKANLYDRALTPDEVLASSKTHGSPITEQQVLSVINPSQREELEKLRIKEIAASEALEKLETIPDASDTSQFTELARAIFTFKEFIFIR